MRRPVVEIVEVGPRDGLQAASVTLPPAARAELVRRLARTGLTRIEAVSFVHPGVVPQMAGAEAVIEATAGEAADHGIGLVALVINERGYDRALAAGVKEVRFAYSLSDDFNQRNSGTSSETGARTGERLVERGAADGVRVGIVFGTAFGCPFAGPIPVADVLAAHARFAASGATELIFADTVGVGVPSQVREFSRAAAAGGGRFGFHFHNTRNTGYANAWAAVEGGAHVLDASVGGVGGCPFAPDASGNIATEDLLYMLDREGVDTGVDVHALIDVANWLGDTTELQVDGSVHRVSWYPDPAIAAESASAPVGDGR